MKPLTPVYFDNAATSYPKPPVVYAAMQRAMQYAGGNPGRGGHLLAQRAGETVFRTREAAAAFFHASPENVVFTQNCTHALNLAIQGTVRQGDHVIISSMEHNSVARPVAALAAAGICTYSIAKVMEDNAETIEQFRRCITPRTRIVIASLVSNVTGQILPCRAIAALCREYGLLFIADGAQACGVLPVTLNDGMHILCTAGHKGLYGAMGTGLLISDGSTALRPLMQGGTGSLSASLAQPDFLPDSLESGTVNVPGIAALGAGIRWIESRGVDTIHRTENALCRQFLQGLQSIDSVAVYRHTNTSYAPVVSFALREKESSEVAAVLHQQGFCLRAGLHCAPLAHRTLGTETFGTIRFAPSVFNTPQQVDALLRALRKC